MREHPLIFNTEMMRAILNGNKTQTRRVPVKHYRSWQIGDRIWVRERFGYVWPDDCEDGDEGNEMYGRPMTDKECKIVYYADEPDFLWWSDETEDNTCKMWRPSIHMPRWASRITLEITGLREEYVQDISYENILYEGWDSRKSEPFLNSTAGVDARAWFCKLWDSINKKRGYGWNANPMVKVIQF